MSDTPRTDAMEARVSSECRNLSDETRNWLMQAKSRELNCTLERELAAVKEQLAEARSVIEKLLTAAENIGGKHVTGWPPLFDACVTAEKFNLSVKEPK